MKSGINKISLLSVIILMACAANTFASNFSVLKESQPITQWVKINSQLNNYVSYEASVTDLESSFSTCGNNCRVVKLSTTPFSIKGTLNIKLDHLVCYSTVTAKIPFNGDDGYLTTPITAYHLKLGGTYCPDQNVDVVVSGDAHSNTGYSINIISK